MCGGSGTRLWPLSRKKTPKQFISLFEGQSLFELTIERNKGSEQFVVVANTDQSELCQKQSAHVQTKLLLEEVGRNTAPVITLAALFCEPSDTLLVVPSDHIIKDQKKYDDCIAKAVDFAQSGSLVTFGITPTRPEIGYGYIESNGSDVQSFKEKPDLATAKNYLSKGNYLWNSGMFCFRQDVYLSEMKKHAPEVFEACLNVYEKLKKEASSVTLSKDNLMTIPEISIDYALMERSDNIKVVPCDFYWNDLGSYESLFNEYAESENRGHSKITSIDSKNNLVLSQSGKHISLLGVEDLIIVETEDALLVAPKSRSQDVKKVRELALQTDDNLG